MTEELPGYATTYINYCSDVRTEILEVSKNLWQLRLASNEVTLMDKSDKSELIANLMLAYRHLEDARMRIGKAIQAYDGGISVYNR